MDDELRLAAWLMLSESGAHTALAEKAIERFGWDPNKIQNARSRISQWVSPTDRHHLPLPFTDDWIEITVANGAQDSITPLLHRAAMRGEDQRERESAEPARKIHRVEAKRSKGRARA